MSLLPQDEELLGHVQRAILQVQGDCEKLNITTSNLIEDHRQKQKDIDVSSPQGGGGEGEAAPHPRRPPQPFSSLLLILCSPGSQVLYQGLEKLEKEKANRENLEMEIDTVRAGPRGTTCVPGGLTGHSSKGQEWRGAHGGNMGSVTGVHTSGEWGPSLSLSHLEGPLLSLRAESRQECPGGQSEPCPV